MDPTQITVFLAELSSKFNLKSSSISSCQMAVDEYLSEIEADEEKYFSKVDIKLNFDFQSLVFDHHFDIQPFIKTRIGIFAKDDSGAWDDNLKPVGYYEMETDMEGKNFDDLLVIDLVKKGE